MVNIKKAMQRLLLLQHYMQDWTEEKIIFEDTLRSVGKVLKGTQNNRLEVKTISQTVMRLSTDGGKLFYRF